MLENTACNTYRRHHAPYNTLLFSSLVKECYSGSLINAGILLRRRVILMFNRERARERDTVLKKKKKNPIYIRIPRTYYLARPFISSSREMKSRASLHLEFATQIINVLLRYLLLYMNSLILSFSSLAHNSAIKLNY